MYEAFMADYGFKSHEEVDERFSFRQICEFYKARTRRILEERKFQASLIREQNRFFAEMFGVQVRDSGESRQEENLESNDFSAFGIQVIDEGGGSDE